MEGDEEGKVPAQTRKDMCGHFKIELKTLVSISTYFITTIFWFLTIEATMGFAPMNSGFADRSVELLRHVAMFIGS